MTRWEIRRACAVRTVTERIERALELLAERGLARWEPVETEGRPAERWFAT
jgi:hypothetical protein